MSFVPALRSTATRADHAAANRADGRTDHAAPVLPDCSQRLAPDLRSRHPTDTDGAQDCRFLQGTGLDLGLEDLQHADRVIAGLADGAAEDLGPALVVRDAARWVVVQVPPALDDTFIDGAACRQLTVSHEHVDGGVDEVGMAEVILYRMQPVTDGGHRCRVAATVCRGESELAFAVLLAHFDVRREM